MATSNIFKILAVVLLSAAIFAAGYFSGQSKMHQQIGTEQASGGGDMAGMPGMAGMNMTPGTAMVSPAMQQLIGVRIATVESKTLGKTIRTVGMVAYDE